jgi:predicted nuclease with TOPRIM domain
MSEVSATDLRRLEALEGRLEKSQGEQQKLAAERQQLRAAATESTRRIRELEKDNVATGKKLDAALAENASLAARLEDSSKDLERLQAASLALRTELDTARGELGKMAKSVAQAQQEAVSASKERDELAESLAVAKEQLAGKSVAPVLTPKEVSGLVDGLVADLGAGLPGMAIRDGELQLKVGFEKVGGATGFVVPGSGSPAEAHENLHQISIRFGRNVDLPGQ